MQKILPPNVDRGTANPVHNDTKIPLFQRVRRGVQWLWLEASIQWSLQPPQGRSKNVR